MRMYVYHAAVGDSNGYTVTTQKHKETRMSRKSLECSSCTPSIPVQLHLGTSNESGAAGSSIQALTAAQAGRSSNHS
jgi:hypothetical protein